MRTPSSKAKREGTVQARQIMNQPAITCGLGASLNTAAQRMWEHDCGALPVLNAEVTETLAAVCRPRAEALQAGSTGEIEVPRATA